MKSQSDLRFFRLLENIRDHFAFLFRRGFRLVSVMFVDENYEDWQVTMATEDCIIKIYSYKEKVGLAFSIPQLFHSVGLLELGDLIYGVNENGEFSSLAQESPVDEAPDLMQTARLLEKHIGDALKSIESMLLLLSFDDPPAPSGKLAAMFLEN